MRNGMQYDLSLATTYTPNRGAGPWADVYGDGGSPWYALQVRGHNTFIGDGTGLGVGDGTGMGVGGDRRGGGVSFWSS